MGTLFTLLRRTLILAVVAVAAYSIGASGYFRSPHAMSYELVQAVPPSGLVFAESGICLEPNEQERALVKSAVDVLRFAAADANFLAIGARRLLSNGLYRREGRQSKRVCDELDQYERAAQLINDSDHFQLGRLVEYELYLIAKLPDPRKDLASLVAEVAFSETIQPSETFRYRDIRPLARATLAGLGQHARSYAVQAFEQISIDSSMGTGAAQIAVAGGHSMALEAVERAMSEKLATLPSDRVVPRNTRNRLYEMAYALAYGGTRAKQHVEPLLDLMRRKVESFAPPFGMLEFPPKRMCRVLASITDMPVTELGFDYCSDLKGPYES